MTAIVGTINRRGVAFAADSAATHTLLSIKSRIMQIRYSNCQDITL